MTELAEIQPPKWMRVAERREFSRLIEQRASAGLGVSEAEVEIISGLLSARFCARQLQRLVRKRNAEYDQRRLMSAHRLLAATEASARSLAAQLGI